MGEQPSGSIKRRETQKLEDADLEEVEATDESGAIHNDLFPEGFLPPEFVDELISELPPDIPPPPIPKIDPNGILKLADNSRPNVSIDTAKKRYSGQFANESQFNHLPEEIQGLIRVLIANPHTAVVLDYNWENPPNFTLQFTVIKEYGNKDALKGIFAEKALFNNGIRFRDLSSKLENLPQTLTKGMEKFMDIADIESLKETIEDLSQRLLTEDESSEKHNETVEEINSLPRGMGEQIVELINLIKKVKLCREYEDLCMVEFEYPTWEPRQAWNYAILWKVLRRRKYRKIIEEILMRLSELTY